MKAWAVHWIKPFSWGAVAGAVAWWIVLSFAGWTSSSTAQKQADRQSEQEVIAALAPVCADKFMSLPDAAVKRVALAKASSWGRRDIFPEEWVTLPGERYPDSDLVAACSKLVLDHTGKTNTQS